MRSIKRILLKSKFYTLKYFIDFLVYFNPRIYMKYYIKLLVKSGFKINGTPRFIAKSVRFDDFDRISLGDRLVVSMNVHFLTHDYSYTTALIAINKKPDTDIGIQRNIEVGNNVFIGMNSLILPGTKIEDNVIIGAGSVVRGNLKSNSVYSGNPAQIICNISELAEKIENREYNDFIIDNN
jgi:acetyltransferase-like isoleucine patch superfamily enzyme